jgi:uncharacterized protein (TIGR00251 family)
MEGDNVTSSKERMSKFSIVVKPRAKSEGVGSLEDGTLVVRVNAPPVDGKANERVIELLARHFGVPRRNVRIAVGEGSRKKIVEVL